MTEQELREKALRVAEWWKYQPHLCPLERHDPVWVCQTEIGPLQWDDGELISQAKSQFWQDDEPQEPATQPSTWDADLEAEFQKFRQSEGYEEFKELTKRAAECLPLPDPTPEDVARCVEWILTPSNLFESDLDSGQQTHTAALLDAPKTLPDLKGKKVELWDGRYQYGGEEDDCQPCADEMEALDCCAAGMAQTMDEVDPEPIQLNQSVFAGIESHCRKVIEISNAEINASNSIESRAYYNGAKQAYRDILKMVASVRSGNSPDGDDEVVWNSYYTFGNVTAYVEPLPDSDLWCWQIWGDLSHNMLGSGEAPTIEEAKRLAVEAAKRLNQ